MSLITQKILNNRNQGFFFKNSEKFVYSWLWYFPIFEKIINTKNQIESRNPFEFILTLEETRQTRLLQSKFRTWYFLINAFSGQTQTFLRNFIYIYKMNQRAFSESKVSFLNLNLEQRELGASIRSTED
jgi:hypothetical protein